MSRRVTLAAIGILLMMLALEITSSRQESQTIDEAVHLAAGFSYWKTGDFRMNPEHPPLLKLLAAFPLLFTKATLPVSDPSWAKVDEWKFGEVFMYQNRLSPDRLLLLGRLPIMLLSLVLGWFIFKASHSMFGPAGGLLSLGLYAFEPSIIAHSRYITTDLGFTAFAFFSLIRLYSLWQRPTRRNAICFGLVLLIAGLTKFSFMAWAVGLVAVFIILKLTDPKHPVGQAKNITRALAWGLPLALIITWAIYSFDVRRPIDDPRVLYLYQQRQDVINSHIIAQRSPLERFVVLNLGDQTKPLGQLAYRALFIHYPLYTFFRGGISVLGHSDIGNTSFLLGQTRDTGWWYYFPVAFITKTSLPTLVAFGGITVTILFMLFARRQPAQTFLESARRLDRRWLIFSIAPTIFFLISLFSHLDLGWRYIMPIFPPLLVLAGSVTTWPWIKIKLSRNIAVIFFLAASIVTAAKTWPNQLGYFNALAGGSRHGYKILRDSNLDWGQDLPKLRTFMRQQNLTSIAIAYYGAAHVDAYIPNPQPVPTNADIALSGRPHGYVAISIQHLYDEKQPYHWLKVVKPQTTLGSSIIVFRFD